MLKLTDVKKSYKTFDFVQKALDGVSITFRDNEFAAILGPSGSGKTTMLNIIGGLDHYDSGDLEIDGISTQKYKSKDWDTYRNNRIGFVFQSYNLITHQTILANVEMALTLSGVPAKQRRARAIEALTKVGLQDHIRKKPSQLSGGQMQRVAIARALINDPEILLADEPTGALDTQTSLQVMELLTEIAKDRLVIMVTHNNELAEQYATRIVSVKDGKIIGDTRPFDPSTEVIESNKVIRKAGMSFWMAINLSFSNLMTKKGRTFVTALAGSIGIIGIAAILALSNGINNYIKNIEQETMSIYPITITSSGFDLSSMVGRGDSDKSNEEATGIRQRNVVNSLFSVRHKNDLSALKNYIDQNKNEIDPYVHMIQYSYDITPQIYLSNTEDAIDQVNPDSIMSKYGIGSSSGMASIMSSFGGSMGGMEMFREMPSNLEMYEYQYEVMAGRWPESYDETVLVLAGNNVITDYELYSMGLLDRSELKKIVESFVNNTETTIEQSEKSNLTYSDLMAVTYKVITPADRYQYDEKYDIWVDKSSDTEFMKKVVDNGVTLKIVGVVQPAPDITSTTLSAGINYQSSLISYLMEHAANTKVVQDQIARPTVNVMSGKTFIEENEESKNKFNFADAIKIDEKAIKNAFNVDTSKFNIDLSGLQDTNIDFSSISSPDINVNEILGDLANQVNIPTEALQPIFQEVLNNFMASQVIKYPDPLVQPDSDQMLIDLGEYLADPVVQATLESQLSGIIEPGQIQGQITSTLQNAMQNIMQAYVSQIMGVIQWQIESTMNNALSQLPEQMQSAISIDSKAFANAFKLNMSENDLLELMTSLMSVEESTYDRNLNLLGYADSAIPSTINIYPLDFNSKQNVADYLTDYNNTMKALDQSEKTVSYTDIVGLMMSSVTNIIDMVSYALIAFVAISLIVSSIMIGVITYISVLERKKEIGILRALGASKGNIRLVFNAETLIVGLVAGLLGVGVTYAISVIANIIIYNEFGIANISQLPFVAAVILVAISMFLTFIAGLFPSSAAARKDPVEALRSE